MAQLWEDSPGSDGGEIEGVHEDLSIQGDGAGGSPPGRARNGRWFQFRCDYSAGWIARAWFALGIGGLGGCYTRPEERIEVNARVPFRRFNDEPLCFIERHALVA